MVPEMKYHDVFAFEDQLAEYTGAPYAVVTDSGTHALELCMRLLKVRACEFPAQCHISTIMMMRKLGIDYSLIPQHWRGEYQFQDTPIWNSAHRLEPRMYRTGQMQCLSFGYGKPLQLGRCGAILLDDVEQYDILSHWRSDGRDLRCQDWTQQLSFGPGYHYLPDPRICERGLTELHHVRPQIQEVSYPDLRSLTWI